MRHATFGFILATLVAVPAVAQEAPRCGGLLCDLGMFGGPGSEKTSLPCNDFLCRAAGGSRQPDVAPVAAVAEPAPASAPKKITARKHHAKVVKAASPDAMVPETAPDKK